jgi:hypothetical protein
MVLAAVVGLIVGSAGALAVQDDGDAPALAPVPRASVTPAPPEPGVLLVWTPDHLPADLGTVASGFDGVDAVTTVWGGDVSLVASADTDGHVVDAPATGWAIPLDAIGVDSATFDAFVPRADAALLRSLAPGRALLGATSARLRRLGPGATLGLAGGTRLAVGGVLADALVGGAELVVSAVQAAALGMRERYLLVSYRGDRYAVETAIRGHLGPTAIRFRVPGETPFLRQGDAVLPQALVKDRFGEFAYREVPGRDVELDPGWIAGNIVTASVPLLGRVRCHRGIVEAVRGALAELESDGLGYLVSPAGYAGCFASRAIAAGAPLSRHAWGIALDVNVGKNPTGLASVQDPRLVNVMRKWGFTSGADWLVPDPAHFEYLRPPRR